MAEIRPFRCIRPDGRVASKVAALPYDVYDGAEARIEAEREQVSFLNIDRPETQFPEGADPYEDRVYAKASELLSEWIKKGVFIREEQEACYLYELTAAGRCQTGVVSCVSLEDYENGIIRRHENTREDKEQDRVRHIEACRVQTGPIFLAYRTRKAITDYVGQLKQKLCPIYDFTSQDGIRHRIFRIAETEDIRWLAGSFGEIQEIYIADGHHRAAAAVKAGRKQREQGRQRETASGQFILSVLFPENELRIYPYNRLVADLNGMTKESFLDAAGKTYKVSRKGQETAVPEKKGAVGLYLDGSWYLLEIRDEILEKASGDPVVSLDVSLLQDCLLHPVLGIEDPRTDKRIDFAGGIRGPEELVRRVENGTAAAAFLMYPTSMEELFAVSDAGRLMPPKSTWFEPKLRSGLFLHEI